MSEKIYLGNGVQKFDGNLIEISLDLTKLGQLKEHFFEYNGTKYIKLKVNKKKVSPDQYGKTHYVTLNDYEPEQRQDGQQAYLQDQGKDADEANNEDDIPF
jgi:hypothetical protein